MPAALPFALPSPLGDSVDLLVIAGEHSGDEHAARLVQSLLAHQPGLRIAALGGRHLAAAGAQLLHDLTASSVVGFVEVLKNYSYFKGLLEATTRWVGTHRPRAVLFIDYPGFNLRLADNLHAAGLSARADGPVKLLYYISPQIWAWKAGRRFKMARHLDALAVIFPFEIACYQDTDLPVDFVGHPFLDHDYAPPVCHDPDGPILLLPGSRRQAVARIFPLLLAGHAAYGKRHAIVLYPDNDIRAVLEAAQPPANVRLLPTNADSPAAASAVLMSSGTMSLHVALAAIPGAIAYRANPLTYLLGRLLVKIPYLGISNLLLKEPMYPEYLQGAARPAALAAELRACLESPDRLARTRDQATRLRASLTHPASGTPANWLLRHL